MINKTIGHIILKGGTSEDIRKELPDFPLNPTKEYFFKLGYKDSTAALYLSKLRNNDKNSSASSINVTTESSDASSSLRNDVETAFVKSGNIDYNNLLIDTCALMHNKATSLIDRAEHVTFINATIKEMDNKKKGHKKLSSRIKLYTDKILLDSQKYMLSTFAGLNNERYPDNILLQYLMILPKQIRPTLLTADKNLAVKARMWDLSCILYVVPTEKNKENNVEKSNLKRKKLGFGVYRVNENDDIYIEYKGTQRVTIIHQDGTETPYRIGGKMKVDSEDQICIYWKDNGTVTPKYVKLK